MTKVISLFNHKGGVSKTTTTFNLGWTFAELGFKVLIVDTDPQCNLTSYVLGLQSIEDFSSFYDSKQNGDIYSSILPIIEGERVEPKAITTAKTGHENLFLVAGHISMAELDVALSVGLAGSRFLKFSEQFIGAVNSTIRETAKKEKCDLVLIDMSPSASALNRCILMGSDYFIIPTSPDFFCYQAIQSLSKMIPQWDMDFKSFRDSSIKNSLPENKPQLLGILSQRYNLYTKKDGKEVASSFQYWIDKIQKASFEILAQGLKKSDMIINEEIFRKYVTEEQPYNLISIPNFNSLIAKSQEYNKPIFRLTQQELGYTGKVLDQQRDNQEKFLGLFMRLASIISSLIGLPIADKKKFDALIKRASEPLQS